MALGAELSEHLGHPPGSRPTGANVRNGGAAKTVQTDLGPVRVRTPRDRDGSFEPQLVAKRQTRLAGLDDKILGLYAGGMTVRDISTHLAELYGVDISRDTISRVTDADEALIELERFEVEWGTRYQPTVAAWRTSWEHVIPFLSLPDELRKAVYTTNTIEGLHRQIRKAIKTRGHFPDEQAATKLIYLAIMRADAKWQRNRTWTAPRAR